MFVNKYNIYACCNVQFHLEAMINIHGVRCTKKAIPVTWYHSKGLKYHLKKSIAKSATLSGQAGSSLREWPCPSKTVIGRPYFSANSLANLTGTTWSFSPCTMATLVFPPPAFSEAEAPQKDIPCSL